MSGLVGDDPAALAWSPGKSVQKGMDPSFYGCALRILPVDGPPTHAALGWRQPPSSTSGWSPHPAGQPSFPLTFAVFPIKLRVNIARAPPDRTRARASGKSSGRRL